MRDERDNKANAAKNTCNNMTCTTAGSYTPGVERYEFVGFVNVGSTSGIPAACCNVRLSWGLCCRNSQVQTIASGMNYSVDVVINRCQTFTSSSNGNSSPAFSNDILNITGSGNGLMQYNLGAVSDPDGDSLSYALTPAWQGYNTPVTYISPYTYLSPLPYSGTSGMQCDASTGVVSFSPRTPVIGQYFNGVLCVEIKQWKKISGVMINIGMTRRDMQVGILPNLPPNNAPVVTTYPLASINQFSSPKTDWMFPAGIQTCFTIATRDTDSYSVFDTTRFDTSNAFANLGGIFTRLSSASSMRDSIQFCWTPTSAQESSYPYVLNVKARDSRVPNDGRVHYGFKILVPSFPLLTSTGIKDTAKACNFWDLSYSLQLGSIPVAQTRWTINKLLPGNVSSLVYTTTGLGAFNLTNQHIMDSGRYVVSVDLFPDASNPLVFRTYTDTIYVAKYGIRILGYDTLVCPKTMVPLKCAVYDAVGTKIIRWQDNTILYTGAIYTANAGVSNRWLTVSVQDSLNCIFTDSVSLQVFSIPTLKIAPVKDTVQCETGNDFKLYNNTNYSWSTYSWLLDDSITYTTDTVQFSLGTVGSHVLKLIGITPEGCIDTVQQQLILRSKPKAAFTVNDSTQCLKSNSFVFTNQSMNASGGITYNWSTGTNTSTTLGYLYVYPAAGIQSIRLIATNSLLSSCKDTIVKSMYIYPQPTVSNTINNSSQCFKNNSFILTNTTTQDSTLSFKWIIDGDSSTTNSVTKSFATEGVKTATLRMNSTYGCNDTLVKTVTVLPSPVADFGMSDSIKCFKGNTFTFTNQSSIIPANNGLGYNWNMGNGATNNALNVTYTYPSAGKYTVRLITNNFVSTQCKDTMMKVVTIFPQPSLAGTVNAASQCLTNNQFVFTNTSTDLIDTNYTFNWKVEGGTKTGTVLTEKYTSSGAKVVKLFANTNKGCIDSATFTVIVHPQPVAQININDTDQCIRGNSFVFTNTSTGATSGSFMIDGASPNTNTSVTKAFTGTGTKSVRLVATSNANCRDTVYKQVEVLYSPTVIFTVSDSTVCKNDPITFTNTSSNTVPVLYRWAFADSTYDSLLAVTKSFPTSGAQRVYLGVATDKGCVDSVSKNILVYASPATPVVSGPISFASDSTVTYSVVSNPTLNYQWQINNGQFVSTNLDTNSIDVKWDSTSSHGRIFVSTQNVEGCRSDTTRYDVSIIGGVGLSSVDASFQNLSVFPNPTTDAITLSLNSIQTQYIRVKLYNIVGTEIKTISYNAPKGTLNEQINLHELQKGIYFMRIEGETGSQTVKILLK
ncbi:MAG: PKD domain-containing protein [Bacteroidota bacterium]